MYSFGHPVSFLTVCTWSCIIAWHVFGFPSLIWNKCISPSVLCTQTMQSHCKRNARSDRDHLEFTASSAFTKQDYIILQHCVDPIQDCIQHSNTIQLHFQYKHTYNVCDKLSQKQHCTNQCLQNLLPCVLPS